jgi:16S rRNA (uracil1498-N3)-methyltransferase
MNHFFAEEIESSQGWLNADESHHALRVLRLKAQAEITISLGNGEVFLAQLANSDPKRCGFNIIKLLRTETPKNLHLAIAPTKSNDRFEFFLEKASELGVAEITPIICQNSERKIYKTERGKRVILAAAKQSKKGFLPRLNPVAKFSTFIKEIGPKAYLAHLEEGQRTSLAMLNCNEKTTVFIGPEGDFSPNEIAQSQKAGLQFLSLGEEVLRTETAGLIVAAAFNLAQQKTL